MNRGKTLGAAGVIALALVATAGCMKKDRAAAPAPSAEAPAVAAAARDGAPGAERRERPAAGSMREIHAQLDIELPAAGATHAAVAALGAFAEEHGGFV